MCLSKERSHRHDEHPAARPRQPQQSQSAMPIVRTSPKDKDAPEMRERQVPATTAPASAMPLPASRHNHGATTNTSTTDTAFPKIPAQPARSKQVIVSQVHDVAAQGHTGVAVAGDAANTSTGASGPPRRQRGSIQAPTTGPHPLQEAPLRINTTAYTGPRGRQPSTSMSAGPEKWAAMAAVDDDKDIDSLRLTLSRSGSVSAYATSPRMSLSSVGGVATRTKTRDRIVVIDEGGNRREYFR